MKYHWLQVGKPLYWMGWCFYRGYSHCAWNTHGTLQDETMDKMLILILQLVLTMYSWHYLCMYMSLHQIQHTLFTA